MSPPNRTLSDLSVRPSRPMWGERDIKHNNRVALMLTLQGGQRWLENERFSSSMLWLFCCWSHQWRRWCEEHHNAAAKRIIQVNFTERESADPAECVTLNARQFDQLHPLRPSSLFSAMKSQEAESRWNVRNHQDNYWLSLWVIKIITKQLGINYSICFFMHLK